MTEVFKVNRRQAVRTSGRRVLCRIYGIMSSGRSERVCYLCERGKVGNRFEIMSGSKGAHDLPSPAVRLMSDRSCVELTESFGYSRSLSASFSPKGDGLVWRRARALS